MLQTLYHMEDNKLAITSKHIQDLKSNKINWLDLVYGSSGKKDVLDYYNCEYKCPESGSIDYKDLVDVLKKTRGVIEYVDTDEMNNSFF